MECGFESRSMREIGGTAQMTVVDVEEMTWFRALNGTIVSCVSWEESGLRTRPRAAPNMHTTWHENAGGRVKVPVKVMEPPPAGGADNG